MPLIPVILLAVAGGAALSEGVRRGYNAAAPKVNAKAKAYKEARAARKAEKAEAAPTPEPATA